MTLPVLIRHLAQTKIEAYCAQRLPAHLPEQVRIDIEIDGDAVTLIESRPHFQHPEQWSRLPVARFCFNPASHTWTLFRPHFGPHETWLPYPAKPERDLEKLIRLLDTDQTGAFWG